MSAAWAHAPQPIAANITHADMIPGYTQGKMAPNIAMAAKSSMPNAHVTCSRSGRTRCDAMATTVAAKSEIPTSIMPAWKSYMHNHTAPATVRYADAAWRTLGSMWRTGGTAVSMVLSHEYAK
eukprot:CAMPEP_0198602632 /NCGR_PEP_ID=MMETSP1462-20131121/150961_1 /TAXON_ID=1333877 /ORGANISM="Brandtodinium nutriculum, Strain RCC3387" /LENGTH=122 /DNA_ID=CAMNT_0044334399 /DNA_START=147 /DNA_END=515 /DNA_ORIENTATION=+